MEGRLALGRDPVAVAVDESAGIAYVSDNEPGQVYAVALQPLRVLWTADVAGRPGPLLIDSGRLYVSLFAADAVAELDPANGHVLRQQAVGKGPGELADSVQVACSDGSAWDLGGHSRAAGRGFGLADGPGGLWTADYQGGELVRLTDGRRVGLPAHLHAFWLATDANLDLLVAAEGDDEDADPGAVFRLGKDLHPLQLATARDPDQVAAAGSRVFVAAHGDRQITVLQGGAAAAWARGAPVVALAPAARLGLLVAVVNARE